MRTEDMDKLREIIRHIEILFEKEPLIREVSDSPGSVFVALHWGWEKKKEGSNE